MEDPHIRILAVDPGYERCGIAVVEKTTEGEHLLFSDCLRTPTNTPFSERLYAIGALFARTIDDYTPTVCALERLYFNTNQKTAMMVAEVRGALTYIARHRGLTVREFTPSEIKIAITGNGKSDKQQVTHMVGKLIAIQKPIQLDDEYDAIAVGLTCLASPEKK